MMGFFFWVHMRIDTLCIVRIIYTVYYKHEIRKHDSTQFSFVALLSMREAQE